MASYSLNPSNALPAPTWSVPVPDTPALPDEDADLGDANNAQAQDTKTPSGDVPERRLPPWVMGDYKRIRNYTSAATAEQRELEQEYPLGTAAQSMQAVAKVVRNNDFDHYAKGALQAMGIDPGRIVTVTFRHDHRDPSLEAVNGWNRFVGFFKGTKPEITNQDSVETQSMALTALDLLKGSLNRAAPAPNWTLGIGGFIDSYSLLVEEQDKNFIRRIDDSQQQIVDGYKAMVGHPTQQQKQMVGELMAGGVATQLAVLLQKEDAKGRRLVSEAGQQAIDKVLTQNGRVFIPNVRGYAMRGYAFVPFESDNNQLGVLLNTRTGEVHEFHETQDFIGFFRQHKDQLQDAFATADWEDAANTTQHGFYRSGEGAHNSMQTILDAARDADGGERLWNASGGGGKRKAGAQGLIEGTLGSMSAHWGEQYYQQLAEHANEAVFDAHANQRKKTGEIVGGLMQAMLPLSALVPFLPEAAQAAFGAVGLVMTGMQVDLDAHALANASDEAQERQAIAGLAGAAGGAPMMMLGFLHGEPMAVEARVGAEGRLQGLRYSAPAEHTEPSEPGGLVADFLHADSRDEAAPTDSQMQETAANLPYSAGTPNPEYGGLPNALDANGRPIIARNGNPVLVATVNKEESLIVKSASSYYLYDPQASSGGYRFLKQEAGDGTRFHAVVGRAGAKYPMAIETRNFVFDGHTFTELDPADLQSKGIQNAEDFLSLRDAGGKPVFERTPTGNIKFTDKKTSYYVAKFKPEGAPEGESYHFAYVNASRYPYADLYHARSNKAVAFLDDGQGNFVAKLSGHPEKTLPLGSAFELYNPGKHAFYRYAKAFDGETVPQMYRRLETQYTRSLALWDKNKGPGSNPFFFSDHPNAPRQKYMRIIEYTDPGTQETMLIPINRYGFPTETLRGGLPSNTSQRHVKFEFTNGNWVKVEYDAPQYVPKGNVAENPELKFTGEAASLDKVWFTPLDHRLAQTKPPTPPQPVEPAVGQPEGPPPQKVPKLEPVDPSDSDEVHISVPIGTDFGNTYALKTELHNEPLVNLSFSKPFEDQTRTIPDNSAALIGLDGQEIVMDGGEGVDGVQYTNSAIQRAVQFDLGADGARALRQSVFDFLRFNGEERSNYISQRLHIYTVSADDPRVALRGGRGVRAASDIRAGELIGTYAGQWLAPEEVMKIVAAKHPAGSFLFNNRQRGDTSISTFGPGTGNATQLINANTTHNPNEIPAEANLGFSVVRIHDAQGRSHNVAFVYARADIRSGDELLVDYQPDYWSRINSQKAGPSPKAGPSRP